MITYKHGFHKGGDFVLSKKNFSYIAKKIRTFATLVDLLDLLFIYVCKHYQINPTVFMGMI